MNGVFLALPIHSHMTIFHTVDEAMQVFMLCLLAFEFINVMAKIGIMYSEADLFDIYIYIYIYIYAHLRF